MNRLLLLDGNWLLHRAVSISSKHSSAVHRKAPLLILSWVATYALKFRSTHLAICFDGPSNFRYEVYPEYKANRSNKEETFGEDKSSVYDYLTHTKSLCEMSGVPVFQLEKYESDDLLASGARTWSSYSDEHKTIICCRDKDLLQTINRQVSVYTPEINGQPERLFDFEQVRQSRGMTPKQFADYQILTGDAVDNVPSILSSVKAKQKILEFGSLKKWFDHKEGADFFHQNSTELLRNQALIRLHNTCWQPTEDELRLVLSKTHDAKVLEQFGNLPKSFVSLRSISSSKASLF